LTPADTPPALVARDFTCRLWDGRSIHLFNVIDDFNREGLGINVDFSLLAARFIRSLDKIIE